MPMPRLRLSSQPTIITRADRARAAGEWQLAAGLYRVALDRTPHNPPIWIQYGHALKECGKEGLITRADRAKSARHWLLAARLYRKALDRNPNNPPIWVQYGHALKEAGMAEAERAYRAALSYASGVADTHLQLGHVLKLQGKTEEAEAAYLRALALDVSLAAAAHELAGLGWTQEHLSAMEIAVGQKPRDGQALRAGAVGSLDGVHGTAA